MALLHEHIEGKYEILEKLKEGGMGAIYKVRHRLLDEVRVVKVIRAHMEPTGETGERFLREARVANRLRHPNIAALHDFAIAEDGNAFIVMEFIDGLNLLEILQTAGPPPVSLTLEIARQSLKALGYLHRQKLVHRDVSPDNLMLTRDVDGHAQIKLIDLGIAKAFEGGAGALTTTGIFLGKPRYAAPEQFGTASLDARSDIYSFGVVLYELLTGKCPVSGKDPASYMAGHIMRPPMPFEESDPRGRVPAELRAAVLRALAKKPEERFESSEDFIWALTLLQDRFPLTGRELEQLFTASLPAFTRPLPLPTPGSTQDKLDREFLMTGTPEATRLHLVEPAQETRRSTDLDDTLPMGSAREKKETSLLDATWLSVPRRVEPPPVTVEEPPRSGWKKIAAAAVLLAGAAAGGFLWLSRKPAPEPEPVPEVRIPAPATVPASFPAAESPTPTPELIPTPAPPPAAPRKIKEVAPEDAVVVGEAPLPMRRGDLILRGLPNVIEPEPLDFPAYSYPAGARGSGKEARVRVRVLVDEEGRVIEANLREGDGSGLGFNEVALETARKTPFHPGTRDDIPGRMWTELIFEFSE
ncbi:MAG TPA: TonB family protein [Thermoanaerobaculia bacterium]|nr:TonB family protein [Thermoanaerobaculia bacterium]